LASATAISAEDDVEFIVTSHAVVLAEAGMTPEPLLFGLWRRVGHPAATRQAMVSAARRKGQR
jgi:hypothetical protein